MSSLPTNIFSLFLIQGANYILPLITIPYLIRVVGIENFGLLAFAAAFVQYFVVLTDYGFGLSAPRRISILRDQKDALSNYISSIFVLKFLFLFFSAVLLTIVVALVPEYKANWLIYSVTFLLVVGNVIYPGWLFLGLEKMPMITAMNVSAKVLSVAAIFIFVSSPDDLVLAAIFQSAGTFIAGLIGIFAMKRLCPGVHFVWPGISALRDCLIDGWHIFISQLSAIMVNGSNIFLLGVLQGPAAVGYYAVAEKIIKAANNAQVPVCNSIYPRVSRLFTQSPEEALAFLRKTTKIMLPLMFFGSVLLIVLADYIVYLLSGKQEPDIALMIRILAFVPTSVFVDNIFGTQILLNIGKKAAFSKAIWISGILSVCMTLVLVPLFGAVGSAINYLVAQLVLLMLVVTFAKGAGITLFLRKQ